MRTTLGLYHHLRCSFGDTNSKLNLLYVSGRLPAKACPCALLLQQLSGLSVAGRAGDTTTKFLESLTFAPHAIEVLSPGINTTVQVRHRTGL